MPRQKQWPNLSSYVRMNYINSDVKKLWPNADEKKYGEISGTTAKVRVKNDLG